MIFDCFELNIIVQNLNTDNKEVFIEDLLRLKSNTEAKILRYSIDSLIDKIGRCSNEDIKSLHRDVSEHRINPMEAYIL